MRRGKRKEGGEGRGRRRRRERRREEERHINRVREGGEGEIKDDPREGLRALLLLPAPRLT